MLKEENISTKGNSRVEYCGPIGALVTCHSGKVPRPPNPQKIVAPSPHPRWSVSSWHPDCCRWWGRPSRLRHLNRHFPVQILGWSWDLTSYYQGNQVLGLIRVNLEHVLWELDWAWTMCWECNLEYECSAAPAPAAPLVAGLEVLDLGHPVLVVSGVLGVVVDLGLVEVILGHVALVRLHALHTRNISTTTELCAFIIIFLQSSVKLSLVHHCVTVNTTVQPSPSYLSFVCLSCSICIPFQCDYCVNVWLRTTIK